MSADSICSVSSLRMGPGPHLIMSQLRREEAYAFMQRWSTPHILRIDDHRPCPPTLAERRRRPSA